MHISAAHLMTVAKAVRLEMGNVVIQRVSPLPYAPVDGDAAVLVNCLPVVNIGELAVEVDSVDVVVHFDAQRPDDSTAWKVVSLYQYLDLLAPAGGSQ